MNQDWIDDAENVRDADQVEVSWVSKDSKGNIIFQSDMTITGAQAAAMFLGIGSVE